MEAERPFRSVYVVVRFDPAVSVPELQYTAEEVVHGAALARAEVERLERLHGERGIRFFTQPSRLYVPGGTTGTNARPTEASAGPKHASVDELLRLVASHFDPATYEVIDHWPADPYAIGISARSAPARFAYLSTLGLPPERYNVHLERAPDPRMGTPYEDDGYHRDIDFGRLAELVTRHLQLRPAAPDPAARSSPTAPVDLRG